MGRAQPKIRMDGARPAEDPDEWGAPNRTKNAKINFFFFVLSNSISISLIAYTIFLIPVITLSDVRISLYGPFATGIQTPFKCTRPTYTRIVWSQ